jgi:uncharacterized protein YozE (UPF0346 family)
MYLEKDVYVCKKNSRVWKKIMYLRKSIYVFLKKRREKRNERKRKREKNLFNELAHPKPHASEQGSISRNKRHIVFANCQAPGALNMGS